MIAKNKRLTASHLTLILDKATCGQRSMAAVLCQAIAGGVDIVQWRDKISAARSGEREAASLCRICRDRRIPFIINDRVDIALKIGPDGIHLGQDDFPIAGARKIFGRETLIGLSCRTLNQMKAAPVELIDYFGFGPVFPTKTKPGTTPKGAAAAREAMAFSPLPVFAIGGITGENLRELGSGKQVRIAVCREICLAKNITQTTRLLKKKLIELASENRG